MSEYMNTDLSTSGLHMSVSICLHVVLSTSIEKPNKHLQVCCLQINICLTSSVYVYVYECLGSGQKNEVCALAQPVLAHGCVCSDLVIFLDNKASFLKFLRTIKIDQSAR